MNIIDSIKHPVVKAAIQLNTPTGRASQKRYLIEGEEMLKKALESQVKLVCAFFVYPPANRILEEIAERVLAEQVPCYRVSQGILFKILGTGYETVVTAIGVLDQPAMDEESLLNLLKVRDTLIMVGEEIQDPRNVGVLIRTADAAGISAFVLSKTSADPFSRSAVRSTTGSVIQLPILIAPELKRVLEKIKAAGIRLISTSVRGSRLYWEADLTGPSAFVFGNETKGVSEEIRQICDEELRIPILGKAHSLNVTVAAGIILYESIKQRQKFKHGR